jgi:putative ABC transport system ATP-binding protein
MKLLEIRGLKKEYFRNGKAFYAADDINLSSGEGDFICITGPSGSGKSTLLNMISGLIEPTEGSIVFAGRDLSRLSDGERSRLRNDQIGYIPQGQSILQNLSAIDNVLFPFYLHKKNGNPMERAKSLLDRMGILDLAEAYPAQMSGGELRRAAIARSLINSPKMLVADEPTVALDPKNAMEVIRIFREISSEGTSVLLVTHDSDIARGGDRVFFMESGRLSETNRAHRA